MKQNLVFSFFLARKFLLQSGTEKTLGIMVKICALSICISTFGLALVAAIMQGFEDATYKTIKGIHPDLIIASHTPLAYEKIDAVLKKEFANSISASTPYRYATVLVSDQSHATQPVVAHIIAIRPENEAHVTALESRIIVPRAGKLSTLTQNNSVLIGASLASTLRAWQGDSLTLLYSNDLEKIATQDDKEFTFEKYKVRIDGMFKTGIDDFDATTIIVHEDFFEELFEHGITAIGLKLAPHAHGAHTKDMIKKRLHLDTREWHELYPSLVSALVLEKYAMLMILALISLIASMNIASLLYSFITYKRSTIALLKTSGMHSRAIIKIFVLIGMLITGGSALIGLTAAWLVSIILEKYPLITLPDVYYVSHLPAHMSLSIACIVLGIVFSTSLLATWLSTRRIHTLSITKILSGGAE